MDLKPLGKIQYGVYIISSGAGGKMSGQIANTVMQVTAEPVNLTVCVSKKNFTFELIEKSKKFSVTALSEDTPFEFMGKFGFKSGRDINKFENAGHYVSQNDIPVVTQYATAVYEVDVIFTLDLGTHVLFAGKTSSMKFIDETKNTMTYDYYHKVKGGLTAKNAPTYRKP